jgi:rare lipoprotein A
LERNQVIFAHHRPQLYLQVGAFEYPGNAQRLENELHRITQRNIRITHNDPHSRFYRVQIGPLQNVNESDYLVQRIQSAGLGHAITVIG